MSEHWGPWVEHDGLGRPASIRDGDWINAVLRSGRRETFQSGTFSMQSYEQEPNRDQLPAFVDSWLWVGRVTALTDVMHYRVRRYPSAARLIEEVTTMEREDAL